MVSRIFALLLLVVASAKAFVPTWRTCSSQVSRRDTCSNILVQQEGSSLCSARDADAAATSTATSTSSGSTRIGNDGDRRWEPKIASLEERRKLRGQARDDETINSLGFHHIEFYCGDAKSTALRFSLALGFPITCVTGQATGNDKCASYGLQSGDVRFLFTAPYAGAVQAQDGSSPSSTDGGQNDFDAPHALPSFDNAEAHGFFRRHGLAVKAVGLEAVSAQDAFDAAVAKGAKPVMYPVAVPLCRGITKSIEDDDDDIQSMMMGCEMAEVELYGDVVLRFISSPNGSSLSSEQGDEDGLPAPFLPHLAPHPSKRTETYGIRRIDHAVGNVPNLLDALTRISTFTGFHEFAEFTSEDVGTVESGLNSVVLASDSEDVLLPLNEPTEGKRKSQIQTFLEQNEGAGLQHLALKTDDIFETIRKMRQAEDELGGFELMRRPSNEYYRELPERLGDQLTPGQYESLEELGILADADDEGVLLQIFTKPIGDRPTFFIEIIQRIGCRYTAPESEEVLERPGCGGFGRGNFKELFKSIEDYEKSLKV